MTRRYDMILIDTIDAVKRIQRGQANRGNT